jgi:hypothetical protein
VLGSVSCDSGSPKIYALWMSPCAC